MPFRASEYACFCANCKSPTEHSCFRCGQPLCDRHSPPVDKRCTDCEAEYQSNKRPILAVDPMKPALPVARPTSRWPWVVLTANTIVGLSFLLPADVFFALFLVVPMLSLVALEAARWFAEQVVKNRLLQDRQARLAFLAERKTPIL